MGFSKELVPQVRISGRLSGMTRVGKFCPECGHEFRGNGWDGIDAHWRAKHSHILAYEEAWPLISRGGYERRKAVAADSNESSLSSGSLIR
jgi:hypothetical protein